MNEMRVGPRHRYLGDIGFYAMRGIASAFLRIAGFHAPGSSFARDQIATIRKRLQTRETVYLAAVALPGTHNTGVALIEVTQAHGPRLLVNNEEERFSGNKHTTEFPRLSLEAAMDTLRALGRGPEDIAAWVTTWDYAALAGTIMRSVMEEWPDGRKLLRTTNTSIVDSRLLEQMTRAPKILGKRLKLGRRVPLIMMPHHENHAWFSFAASPFDDSSEAVAVAVLDGTGDAGSVTLYRARNGELERLAGNDSVFDSLGAFYSVISSTQGGWTWLSSEGRYMGAAAWGDMNRATNRFYAPLRQVLHFGDDGMIRLNRAMANWYCDPFDDPYKAPLTALLGRPLTPAELWNPDAVLRVEDIQHSPATQERLDKAAATQLVFEDALIHIVDHLLRTTGTHRLVLTGGVALNALANMRLLEHFNEDWFEKTQGRRVRLHLWVPPTPGDPGVPIGAAWRFAHLAGASRGEPLIHAFACGEAASPREIETALATNGIASRRIGDVTTAEGRDSIADLMAYLVSKSGVIALHQGPAETGPRALGHRSIFANPCDPEARENLNARVKYREAIRPLAPMATLEAAQTYFVLEDGASDTNFNAYNYMVLTAHAKPQARAKIPAVVHADGTGRIQIVRAEADPLTHAYLKALGRRIGVEMSVNTSFNVAGPIAQTPVHAMETLLRAKGLDVLIIVADDGTAYAAWREDGGGRFLPWLAAWQQETARQDA